jgi:hypothetical protein
MFTAIRRASGGSANWSRNFAAKLFDEGMSRRQV